MKSLPSVWGLGLTVKSTPKQSLKQKALCFRTTEVLPPNYGEKVYGGPSLQETTN